MRDRTGNGSVRGSGHASNGYTCDTLKIQLAVGAAFTGAQFPAIPVGLVSRDRITMDAPESGESRRFFIPDPPEAVLKGQMQTLERHLPRLRVQTGQSRGGLAPWGERVVWISEGGPFTNLLG